MTLEPLLGSSAASGRCLLKYIIETQSTTTHQNYELSEVEKKEAQRRILFEQFEKAEIEVESALYTAEIRFSETSLGVMSLCWSPCGFIRGSLNLLFFLERN